MNSAAKAQKRWSVTAMVTISAVFLALTLALTLALAFAASANAVTVHLRVETANETLFNGNVNTGPRTLAAEDLPGKNANFCDSDGPADGTAVTASSISAVADSGLPYGTSGTRYSFGNSMCRIGTYESVDNVASWTVKVNNKINGYNVTGDDPLSEGDTALFYFGGFSIGHSLDIVISPTAQPGAPVTGVVNSWSNSDDSKTPAAGLKVTGANATATTASDGTFSVTFAQPGKYLLRTTDANGAPGSAYVTVDPATPAAPLLVKVNRFVKCNNTYRRTSKMHRRCIRIVRAKQAAKK